MLVQCHFVSGDTHTIGYVEEDWRLRPGVIVTLEDSHDPKRWWKILSVGEPRPRSFLKRGWHNNI